MLYNYTFSQGTDNLLIMIQSLSTSFIVSNQHE